MGNYTSKNRHKYYLKCHLIFVCKYRKPLLQYGLDKATKQLFQKISESSEFSIDIMETDKRPYTFVNIISTKRFCYIYCKEIEARECTSLVVALL